MILSIDIEPKAERWECKIVFNSVRARLALSRCLYHHATDDDVCSWLDVIEHDIFGTKEPLWAVRVVCPTKEDANMVAGVAQGIAWVISQTP